jgi:hypothetical protein
MMDWVQIHFMLEVLVPPVIIIFMLIVWWLTR